jgi:hypothetical protein
LQRVSSIEIVLNIRRCSRIIFDRFEEAEIVLKAFNIPSVRETLSSLLKVPTAFRFRCNNTVYEPFKIAGSEQTYPTTGFVNPTYYPTGTSAYSVKPTSTPYSSACDSLLMSSGEGVIANCQVSNFSSIGQQFVTDSIFSGKPLNTSGLMDQWNPFIDRICGVTNCTNYVKSTVSSIISVVSHKSTTECSVVLNQDMRDSSKI